MAEVNKFPGRGPAEAGGKSSLPPGGEPPYGPSMEARLAVLEQIAANTRDVLVEIKAEMRDIRNDIKDVRNEIKDFRKEVKDEFRDVRQEMKDIRQDQKTDFRITFGALIAATLGLASLIGGLAAIMAHGFKWF
jgi:hypothetical protein